MKTRPINSIINIDKIPAQNRFGFQRKYDIHTGIDLFANEGEPVFSIESGIITNFGYFTGPETLTPWWRTTEFLTIKGESGKFVYGEIKINKAIFTKKIISSGELIGWVTRVLIKDKGLPTTMLHLELLSTRAILPYANTWEKNTCRAEYLLDPEPILKKTYD